MIHRRNVMILIERASANYMRTKSAWYLSTDYQIATCRRIQLSNIIVYTQEH